MKYSVINKRLVHSYSRLVILRYTSTTEIQRLKHDVEH